MIFIRYPFPCDRKVLDFGTTSVNTYQIEDDIGSYLGCNQFSLFYNGRKLQDAEIIPDNSTIHVTFPLPGGKGGFGSMLRAIGAQIEKTTNREACRDLSGRRLRDINEEQRLKKWIAKEAEREAEKIRRRQARIERLKTKAPHHFFDFEYEKKISELPERIDDALSEGLQKVKQPKKRPHENPEEEKLPKKTWLIEDLPTSSSSDSDSDETTAVSEGSSKKMKIAPKESCDFDASESSLSYPSTSKDSTFIPEESTSSSSRNSLEDERNESSTDSDKMDVVQSREGTNESGNIAPDSKAKSIHKEEEKAESTKVIAVDNDTKKEVMPDLGNSTDVKVLETDLTAVDSNIEKKAVPELSSSTVVKESKTMDDTPIDLQDFQSISELEALGLDRLKSALMARGLKCGGTLSDRAQRLWKIRGLQPHQYPSKLLAKGKK